MPCCPCRGDGRGRDGDLRSAVADRSRAELSWLLEQAEELLHRLRPDVLFVKKSASGQRQSSREQHDVEAVVQVAAHRVGVACAIRTTEQVRAAHVVKGKGAYKTLVEREDAGLLSGCRLGPRLDVAGVR